MIRQLIIDTIKDNIIDRYCDFSGTISRGAFWRFMLVEHLIVGVGLAVLGLLSLHSALFIYTIGIVFALWFISIMALTLPNLGAMVRRLHDTNNSEWLLLLGFIPYIGVLIVIVLLLRGTKKHPAVKRTVESFEEIDLFSDEMGNNIQNLDGSSNVVRTSYSRISIIATIILTVVSWGIGIYSFSSAVDKEIDAYLQMKPGAFMIMAQKTLGSDVALESAKQVVIEYYADLNKGQYQEAYRLLAHREREKYGTYDQWSKSVQPNHNRQMNTLFLKGVFIDDEDVNHISFDMTFKEKDYPNRMFIKMIYEHDTWRIESIVPYDQKNELR